VGGSLIAFVIVYFTVFAAGTLYILRLMGKAPLPHAPEPPAPIRSAGITPAAALGQRPPPRAAGGEAAA
jgi:cytochrome d ubiquinol oxidase subunit I